MPQMSPMLWLFLMLFFIFLLFLLIIFFYSKFLFLPVHKSKNFLTMSSFKFFF